MQIRLWDINSGECIRKFGNHEIMTIQILPNDRLATGSTDKSIKVCQKLLIIANFEI